MYEAFYGLKIKPFSILPDPDFIYWGPTHTLAFAMLEYGIMNRAGFTVITGEVGSGKTTLVRHLLRQLPNDVVVGLLSHTQRDRGDLLSWLLMSLGQDFEGTSYIALYKKFENYLDQQEAIGRRTILIVDEAQNLGPEALEELRMLSNLNGDKAERLQIILVGQPELKTLLSRPDLIQFAQRISSDFHLTRLAREEVAAYIDHRLAVAGAPRLLFSDEACDTIATASAGIPRLINVLCDAALTYGYAKEAEGITMSIVQEVLSDKRQYGAIQAGVPEASRP
jgi:general secretion pathway protein A